MALGREKLLLVVGFGFTAAFMQILASSLRGIGFNMYPMMVSLIGTCGSRILWLATVFQIPKFHAFKTIFVIYPISWVLAGIVLLILFIYGYKRRIREHQEEIATGS